MKGKIRYGGLLFIILAVILLTGCEKSEVNNQEKDFYEKISDVSYIELDGPYVRRILNTDLAKMIGDNSEELSNNIEDNSGNATGEQAYVFNFYNEDNAVLYRIQYYSSNDKIDIYRDKTEILGQEIIDVQSIKSDDILQYIKNVIKLGQEEANQTKKHLPEIFDDIATIRISLLDGTKEIKINNKYKTLNYTEYEMNGTLKNTKYEKNNISLSNFPELKDYIMNSKVLDKLTDIDFTQGKNDFTINLATVYGGASYSSDELDDFFQGLLEVLKIDDKEIYGN